MKKFVMILVVAVALSVASCGGEDESDTGNTGDTSADTGDTVDGGNSGDFADTSDSGNTADTGDTSADSGDTADTGDIADTGDTGNTGNTSADTGDTSDTGDTGNSGNTGNTGNTADTGNTGTVSDPYLLGPETVTFIDVAKDQDGAPLPFRLFFPEEAGTYPVVHFIHGFQLKNFYYDEILIHLSSHGFIIVAPQFSQSMLGSAPSNEEADAAIDFIENWLMDNLESYTADGVEADFSLLSLAGHSRGGKTSWHMIQKRPDLVSAIAGVDPVDAEPPIGTDPPSVQGPLTYDAPSLAIGTEKGPEGMQACAPSDSNSTHFYPNFPSPAWHVIAGGVGHMEMMDGDDLASCGMTCSACASSGDQNLQQSFRTLCGGMLTAFFRGALYDEPEMYDYLSDEERSPHLLILTENK